MLYIVPSLLSADFANLQRDIQTLEQLSIEMLHLDVMDGHFVPNITFGPPLVKAIRAKTKMLLDVHLMIEFPHLHIENFAEAGADMISFHYESKSDIESTIKMIKNAGLKAGLAINPDTSAEKIVPYSGSLDFILIMSVFPGFAGQTFMPEVLEKAIFLRENITSAKHPVMLEIDGGINHITIVEAARYGFDWFVAGSSVFNGSPVSENIDRLRFATF